VGAACEAGDELGKSFMAAKGSICTISTICCLEIGLLASLDKYTAGLDAFREAPQTLIDLLIGVNLEMQTRHS
jgi:hypothetical protein